VHTELPQPADSQRFSSVLAAVAKRAVGCALLVTLCLMPGIMSAATTQESAEATNLTTAVDHSRDPVVSSAAARTVNYPDTSNGSINVTSAADLSLFGILALGIIGLLWVRRHTSEL